MTLDCPLRSNSYGSGGLYHAVASISGLPNIYESAALVKSHVPESEATSLLEADCRSWTRDPRRSSQAGLAGNIYTPSIGQE